MKQNGKLLHLFLIVCGFSVLALILYLFCGDCCMKNNCWLKIFICAEFLLCVMIVTVILCTPSKSCCEGCCESNCCSDFVLIHKSKNEMKCIKGDNLNEIMKVAQNGDILRICTDNYEISVDILQNEKHKILLRSNGENCFVIQVENN